MYVVTGGAGFIGSALIHKLNSEGIDNILVVDALDTSDRWKNLVGLKFHDYLDKDRFLDLIVSDELSPRPKAIFHMGACSTTTERDAAYLMETNYQYTRALAEYCIDHKTRFIYASSAATYGDGRYGYNDSEEGLDRLRPLNMYGYSKQLFDLFAARNRYFDRMMGIKFFNVFGPNEYHKGDQRSVVVKAYHQIKSIGCIKLFRSHRPDYADGEQKRDFVYIKDAIDVMYWALENPRVNGLFNLGTGMARTWNDLAAAIFGAMEMKPSIEYADMPAEIRNQYQYFTEAKMTKLRDAGYKKDFTSLEDAVSDFVTNYLDAGELKLQR